MRPSLRTCDPEVIFLGPHWELVNRYTQQLRELPFGSLTHVVWGIMVAMAKVKAIGVGRCQDGDNEKNI